MRAVKTGLNKIKIPSNEYINGPESTRIYSGFRDINQRLLYQIKDGGISVKVLIEWINYAGLNEFNSVKMICNFIRWRDNDVTKPFEERKNCPFKI